MDVPDLAGFRDAQTRLVQGLGTDVTFSFSASATYPSAAYIDLETGKPLDPTIAPLSASSSPPITERATVIRNSPGIKNEATSTTGADIPYGHVWLRLPEGQYDPAILSSSLVTINDEDFLITRFIRDGLDQVDRLYVECSLLHDDLTS